MSFSHRRRSPRVREERATPLEGRSLVKRRSSTSSLTTTTRSWGGRNTTSQSRRGKPAGAEFQLVPPNSTAPLLSKISAPHHHTHTHTGRRPPLMTKWTINRFRSCSSSRRPPRRRSCLPPTRSTREGTGPGTLSLDPKWTPILHRPLTMDSISMSRYCMYTHVYSSQGWASRCPLATHGILFFTYVYLLSLFLSRTCRMSGREKTHTREKYAIAILSVLVAIFNFRLYFF